jgi:hypothetical protein
MTNDPFNEHEAWIWKAGTATHAVSCVVALDVLLIHWEDAARHLAREGLPVHAKLKWRNCEKRCDAFWIPWIARMDPLYLAVSFPPDFQFRRTT